MTKQALLFLALAACGGAPSVDTSDPKAFCLATAQTGCSKMYACLTEDERMQRHLPATEPECERSLKAQCETDFTSCADATHVYAADAAATCLDQMSAATCDDAGQPWLDAAACSTVCERTGGAFEVEWEFAGGYLCSDLNIASVTVVSVGATQTYADQFRCDAMAGVTEVVPVGDYQVHIELFDAGGAKKWWSDPIAHGADADVVDLGLVLVPVGT